MAEWISHWGLLAVFVGAATEGDLTMVLAGASSHLGLLRLPEVIATGFVGSLVSDTIVFALARVHADRMRASAPYRRAAPRLEPLVASLGPWQILTARFVLGTRVPTMLIWGIRRLSWVRFLLLASLGCAAWSSAIAVVGFVSSQAASNLFGEVKRVELWLLGILLVGAAIAVSIRVYRRRKASV